MRQWEYAVRGLPVDRMPNENINNELSKLGETGWEIIAAGWPNHAFVLLKREVDLQKSERSR
jgi:hypothetical protein